MMMNATIVTLPKTVLRHGFHFPYEKNNNKKKKGKEDSSSKKTIIKHINVDKTGSSNKNKNKMRCNYMMPSNVMKQHQPSLDIYYWIWSGKYYT